MNITSSCKKTRKVQHSQQRHDPCRQCFYATWPWLLTFWPQINGFQDLWCNISMSRTFLCQIWRS